MKRTVPILLFFAYVLVMITGCAENPTQEESEWDRRPMAMIDDSIYMDTNDEVSI